MGFGASFVVVTCVFVLEAVELCCFAVILWSSTFDDFFGDLHDDGGFGKFFGIGMLTTGGTAGMLGSGLSDIPSLLAATPPSGTLEEDIVFSS